MNNENVLKKELQWHYYTIFCGIYVLIKKKTKKVVR